MQDIHFSLLEILSLLGLVQCVYILVSIAFRSLSLRSACIPFLYFVVLGTAFFFDFAQRHIGNFIGSYTIWMELFWLLGPCVSALLIIQIVKGHKAFKNAWVFGILLYPAFAYVFSTVISSDEAGCIENCSSFLSWLQLSGVFAGTLSLLSVLFYRDFMAEMHAQKFGKERYWLVLTLVTANIAYLCAVLLSLGADSDLETQIAVRNLIGLAFIYLTTTSLFRIYPHALVMKSGALRSSGGGLSIEDIGCARRIEGLLKYEKIYHEAGYSRTDLAREVNISEIQLSRIINIYFSKSLPQLMNELRVEDAKRLLKQTDAPVKVIGEEVGFNSLASFNRVFKEISGVSPSSFRKKSV